MWELFRGGPCGRDVGGILASAQGVLPTSTQAHVKLQVWVVRGDSYKRVKGRVVRGRLGRVHSTSTGEVCVELATNTLYILAHRK